MDVTFILAQAPGSSAYNKFTCQMVLPAKLTAEIILAFNKFQSNLNPQNQTLDKNLEKQNFQAARKFFAGVQNDSIIDGHPVIAN